MARLLVSHGHLAVQTQHCARSLLTPPRDDHVSRIAQHVPMLSDQPDGVVGALAAHAGYEGHSVNQVARVDWCATHEHADSYPDLHDGRDYVQTLRVNSPAAIMVATTLRRPRGCTSLL
jgi:hypothetical protein